MMDSVYSYEAVYEMLFNIAKELNVTGSDDCYTLAKQIVIDIKDNKENPDGLKQDFEHLKTSNTELQAKHDIVCQERMELEEQLNKYKADWHELNKRYSNTAKEYSKTLEENDLLLKQVKFYETEEQYKTGLIDGLKYGINKANPLN